MALDPNAPIDSSGPDPVYGVDSNLSGHVPTGKTLDTELAFGQTPVLAPVQAALTKVTTGGTLATATYYYKITAIGTGTGGGETNASNERSITTTGSTSVVTASWAAVPGASGYRVYRATTSNSEVLLTTTTATSLVDDGSLTPGTATPPTTNNALFYNPISQYEPGTIDTTGYDAGYDLGDEEVAAGNIQVVTDAATTEDSTEITSASNPFTPGHVDNHSSIQGTGIPEGTFIVGLNSAGSAIMSQAATADGTDLTVYLGRAQLDSSGYGAVNYPAAPAYTGTTNGADAGYAVVPDDTTGANGHTAAFGVDATYGQSLLTSNDQQFGAQSKDDPITGAPDTLGTSGGVPGIAGVPLPLSYGHNVGDTLGNNATSFGAPIFIPAGFDTPSASGDRTTTNDMFRAGITQNFGTVTSPPSAYTLNDIETLYGYPGLTPGSSGTAPTKPLSVSWAFGVGCAVVSWSPPSSTGGNTIREYIVEGYQVRDSSYIPTTSDDAAKFVAEPAVTWKGRGGSFLAAPLLNAITGSASGGTLAAATRYYKVTAVGISGETIASQERSVVNSGSTSSNPLSWVAVTGAASYNVYRGTTSGGEVFLKNVAGTSYSDTGADTPTTAVPPTVGTAVTPTTQARVEHLTPGFYYFFRVYARNDVGTSPLSDPVAGPSAPNNTPKYFMGLGMSGTTNNEMDEVSLLSSEFLADRI